MFSYQLQAKKCKEFENQEKLKIKNKQNSESEYNKIVSDIKENCIKQQDLTNVNSRIIDKINKNTSSRDQYAKSEIDKCYQQVNKDINKNTDEYLFNNITTKSVNSKSINFKFKKSKESIPKPINKFNFDTNNCKKNSSQLLTMKSHPAMNQPDSFVHLKNKNISRSQIKSRNHKTDETNQINNQNESFKSTEYAGLMSSDRNDKSRPMSRNTRPISGMTRPLSVKSDNFNFTVKKSNRPISAITSTVRFDFDDVSNIKPEHVFKNVNKKISKINEWASSQQLSLHEHLY